MFTFYSVVSSLLPCQYLPDFRSIFSPFPAVAHAPASAVGQPSLWQGTAAAPRHSAHGRAPHLGVGESGDPANGSKATWGGTVAGDSTVPGYIAHFQLSRQT